MCTDRRLGVRCLALVAALLILALGAPSTAAAQAWKTTEWIVDCTAATAEGMSESACDDDSVTGPAAIARVQLEEASPWLKALGFYGPDLPTDVAADGALHYLAWINDESPEEKLDDEPWGYYDGTDLNLNNSYFFAMGEDEEALNRDSYHTGAAVHELFHAIQATYDADVPFSREHAWIIEGTAQAALFAWLRQSGEAFTPKTRRYDLPLHKPKCGRVDGKTEYGCYATQQFWTWLGQFLGSTDRIAYLGPLLEQDLDAHRGLTGIHEGLKQWNPEGLYDLYPAFISQFVNDEGFFEQVQQKQLQYRRGQTVEKTQPGTARPVAASAHRLQVAVPAGTSPRLEISFVEDHPDLHLIVDETRLDRPGPSASGHNAFRTSLTGQAAPHEFFVRVANVAENPAASQDRAYTLRYRLTPQPVCRFTADVNGAITGHFEGKATVGFDSAEGRIARATDLTLEGDGFDLKVGLRPALTVGEAGTLEGAMAVAGHGTNSDDGAFEIFGQQEDFGDFVRTEIQESHEIPWKDLPASLRDYLTSMTGASMPQAPTDRTRYEQQVGDVVVRGTLRGQLTQNGGKLIETLGEPSEITFEARFNAQSETFGCDYEGFPEKMEQRMSQMPGGSPTPENMKQMQETFEQMKEKMTEGMSEQMKKKIEEQMEQAKEDGQ